VGGSAVLFDGIDELPEILTAPPSSRLLEAGYRNAERHDYAGHRHVLHDLIEAA
jgi:hypothetical protein